jgi:LysR family transcriptional regulator, regulator of abg operon
MKLQQLQVLVDVVEHGGIRAAARKRHLSQAAVTKSLRSLEEQAGVPLVVRGSRGIALTAAGERLLLRARTVVRQVELAGDELRQAAGEDYGTVRVGVTPLLALRGLGAAFGWFRRRYNNVEVHFGEGLIARALPRLREGTLDLAVVAPDVGELDDDEFRHQTLGRVRQCIVVREGHPVLADPSARALAALEWVSTQPFAGGGQPRVEAMFALGGVPTPSRVVVCDALSALSLLRDSDTASILPQPLLGHPEARGLVAIDPCPLHPSEIELLLLSRADVPLTPAAEYFAHCLGEACRARVVV